jgi:transposase-like protein
MQTEYNETRFFDNEIVAENGNLSAFSLETMVRNAAQRMIQAALEAEVEEFLQRPRGEKTRPGEEFRGYRNGYHKQRVVSSAVGALEVRVPRVSDNRQPFQSRMVKPYKRRSEGLDALFPRLFVEGLATRDFEPCLRFLVGEEAPLSPSSISRLNKQFKTDYEAWQKQDLSSLKIVYLWADGVYLQAGIGEEKACLLVIIGVDIFGEKHFLALREGYRESKESWLEVLRDLRERGLTEPALAIADGGLGFWAALPEVWEQTKRQMCWLHKTRNLLDKLPKSEHKEATERLRAVYLASDGEAARYLAEKLIRDWREAGYERAADCLQNALRYLLTFFEFPAEHARHLRTTNPIESPFATIRLRTNAARRFRTARSGLHLVFKLLERCQKGWQRISHAEKLKEVKLPN